ncbi:hypothetical protein OUZ56_010300 [Daphnia magna]|uniref:Uncharacterized protein n=1 Tax=Daphnia magna TaxID=35525 RepID=A0ABR0AI67_9CRUS|nr:hypothetical protein OUZ56_010300 [Daphnia magna]
MKSEYENMIFNGLARDFTNWRRRTSPRRNVGVLVAWWDQLADDEADDSSDEEEGDGVAHDTRLDSSPEDIRMENVSFSESVAPECN